VGTDEGLHIFVQAVTPCAEDEKRQDSYDSHVYPLVSELETISSGMQLLKKQIHT
jgi:hypothetical protein